MITPEAPWTENRRAFLDRSYEELRDGCCVDDVIDRLVDALYWFRADDPEDWARWVSDVAIAHPLKDLLHTDPFTHRSFAKPRGFAGDAMLLDLIYFDQGFACMRGQSEFAQRLYRRTRNALAPRAVREEI